MTQLNTVNDSRVLVYTDAHVERHGGSEVRLKEALDALEWVYQVAIEKNIFNVVFLGDLFHNRSRVDVQAYHGAYKVIKHARDRGVITHFIIGNHDMFYRERRDITSVAPFEALGPVIDQPCQRLIAGHRVDFLPFVEENVYLELAKYFPSPAPVLFGHVAVEGAILNSRAMTRATVEDALEAESVEDGEGVALVKPSQLYAAGRELVLLGHYHAAQVVQENTPRIEYVGSPLQLSFGEAGDRKRVLILDLETLQTEEVLNKISPTFMVWDIKHDTDFDGDLPDVKNCRVRLRVEPGTDPVKILDLRSRIIKQGGAIWCERRDLATKRRGKTKGYDDAQPTVSDAVSTSELTEIISDPKRLITSYVETDTRPLPHGMTKDEVIEAGVSVIKAVNKRDKKSWSIRDLARTLHIHSFGGKNFGSIGPNGIEVPLAQMDLLNLVMGTNLDVGDGDHNNGCGKSTIFVELILWVLYGKTLGKKQKNEIVNDITGKKCEAWVRINDLIVTRSIKPDKLRVETAAGHDETRSTMAETEAWIETQLGLSWEAINYLMVYDSENMFNFFTVAEARRRDLIENMLSLDLVSYLEEGRTRKRDTKKALDVSTQQIFALESQITQLSNSITQNLVAETEYQSTREQRVQILQTELNVLLATNIEQIRLEIEQEEQAVAEENAIRQESLAVNSRVQTCRGRVKSRQAELDQANRKVKELQNGLRWDVTLEQAEADVKLADENKAIRHAAELEFEQAKSAYSIAANEMQRCSNAAQTVHNKIKALKAREIGVDCPSCYGSVTSENVDRVLKLYEQEFDELCAKMLESEEEHARLEQVFKERKSALDQVKAFNPAAWVPHIAQIRQAHSERDRVQDQVKSATDHLAEAQAELEVEEQHVQGTQQRLEAIAHRPRPQWTRSQVESHVSKIQSLQSTLTEVQAQLQQNPYTPILARDRVQLTQLEIELTDERGSLSMLGVLLQVASFWEEAFATGIRSFLVGEIIEALNGEVSRWLNTVLGGDVELFFDSQLEAQVQLRSTGKVSSWRKLSAGERRRINLATLLAFSQVMQAVLGVELNYVVFDEPVDKLDHGGILGAIEAFHELNRLGKRVVVITHHPTLVSEISSEAQTIMIKKELGFSSLEVGRKLKDA